MSKAAILGAGYMGSAMAYPLVDSGFEVNLWGTWLDDEIIDSARNGDHPKLKKRLPKTVKLFGSNELAKSVEGVDCIFIGASSEGFVPVFQELMKVLPRPVPFFTLTKGFSILGAKTDRTSVIAELIFRDRFGTDDFHWASIGGPVKAYELARSVPSPAIYGTTSESSLELASKFQTDYYRIRTTPDYAGVELCSALKNVYAFAVGLCDGLYEQTTPKNYHNFSSLIFNQAVKEMALVVRRVGGSSETAYDLAGVGDLYVTAQSGKNQRFGKLIGEGMTPAGAYRTMYDEGELAEGYLALKAGNDWLKANHSDHLEELPLFRTLMAIGFDDAPAEAALKEMVSKEL